MGTCQKHCICQCPNLKEIDIFTWLEAHNGDFFRKKLVKPFRTGKEPLNLISKRDFNGPKKVTRKKPAKGNK